MRNPTTWTMTRHCRPSHLPDKSQVIPLMKLLISDSVEKNRAENIELTTRFTEALEYNETRWSQSFSKSQEDYHKLDSRYHEEKRRRAETKRSSIKLAEQSRMVVKKYRKEAEEARKEAEMAREEVFKVREKTAKDHAEMESSVTSANRRAEEAEKQRAAAEKSKEQATIERVAAQAYAKKLEISQADTLKNKNAAEKRYEDLVVTNRNIQLCCTNLA